MPVFLLVFSRDPAHSSMLMFLSSLKDQLSAALGPRSFFQGYDSEQSSRRAALSVTVLLITVALLLTIAAMLSGPEIGLSNEERELIAGELQVPMTPEPSASNNLLFAVNWAFLLVLFGLTRHWITRLLGEGHRSLRDAMTITVLSVGPMIVGILCIGLFSYAFPLDVPHHSQGAFAARILAILATLFALWLWEGAICWTGFRILYDQNNGRAVLTWIAPYLLVFGVLTAIFLFLLTV